jgi:ABC-type multidrug transport system permease subunit
LAVSLPRASAALALIERDYRVARSYRSVFVLDLLFGIINLIVFFFISRTFGDQTTSALKGAPSYFAYAALGIAIVVVMETASVGLSNRLREEQLTGTLEALITQPITALELAIGLAGYPFLFGMLRAAFYVVAADVLLGLDLGRTSWPGFLLIFVVTGVALAGVGMLVGALVLLVKRARVLAGLITFGLGFLGGAFFPISVLPDWLEPIAKVVPTRLAFDGLRAAVFHGGGWGNDVLGLVLFGIVALPLGVGALASSLNFERRSGGLAQY